MVKNNNKLRELLLILVCLTFTLRLSGQSNYNKDSHNTLAVFEYFQAGQYHDVIGLLRSKQELSTDEQILFELSNLKTGQDATKEIREWIVDNKDHPLQSLARFNHAEYSFYQGDSIQSRKLLSGLSAKELSQKDRASYGFIYGTLNLQSGNYKNAQNLFSYAQKNGFTNVNQLAYYQGFTSYHLGENDKATELFRQVSNQPEYGLSSSFFLAKILLENESYDEVIELSQKEIHEEKTTTNSGFHQLIGEAYALKGNLPKADAYFDQAINMHPNRPSAALYYQAGVSKFKIGNEEKALEYLTEAGIGTGQYASLSAFQLGRLYLKRNEQEKALTAYIEASSSEDPLIKEESLYQASLLNAHLKRYSESINYADDYVQRFPEGTWKGELQDLIAECYLRTSNYDLALSHLEELGLTNAKQQEVYQKVAFQKGLLLFNDSKFDESRGWFQESLQFVHDPTLKNEAHFYMGEIYSLENNYRQAIIEYNKQRPSSAETQYGLGYANFNLEQYESAIGYFRSASNSTNSLVKSDAQLRLADCLYATKAYNESYSYYDRLEETDYVIYQKGLVKKNLESNQEALNLFDKVSSNSKWKDDALYEQATIQFKKGEFQDAELRFTNLINNHPNSSYLSKSYLNRGLSRSNQQKYSEAQLDFEKVITDFIRSEESFSAILGLQGLEQKGIAVARLDEYINAYKKANPDDTSLEAVEFEAAKSLYFDFDYENAAIKLLLFLNEYPTSSYKSEADYYLGDSYYRTNRLSDAKNQFDKLKNERNVFSGRILGRLGDINLELGEFTESIEAYQMLQQLDLSPKDNYKALSGLMNAYYQSEQYNLAVERANDIVLSEWKPLNAEPQAIVIKARSWFKLNNQSLALEEYGKLSDGTDILAAESNYYIALIDHQNGKYESSLDKLFELNSKFGAYSEWIDKSYLLIADNYIDSDQLFQAKATLRSIIQHSQNNEIKSKAQLRLTSIEQSTELDTIQTKD